MQVTDRLPDRNEIVALPEERLPRHIAIIMDGNGRWARQQNLPRYHGHRAGASIVKKIILESASLGIKCLTMYSFSTENWKRSEEEVQLLMVLCSEFLARERQELMEKNIRLIHLGRRDRIPDHSLHEIDESVQLTAKNTGMTFCLALNYGGRTEMIDACRAISDKVKAGKLTSDKITEQTISDHLYTAGLPDPDLLIRTANEKRVSNFLLWQVSYAEFYVDPVCWPDFTVNHLYRAILDYSRRARRFGDVASPQKQTTSQGPCK